MKKILREKKDVVASVVDIKFLTAEWIIFYHVKFILSLIISVWFIPVFFDSNAFAETNVKLSGHGRVRTEVDDYTNYSNARVMTFLRVRPKVLWTVNAKSELVFETQFAKALGENAVAASSISGSAEQLSGSTADPSLGVHQAYLSYQFTESFKVVAGRQVLSFGDDLVVGPLEWNNVARTFEALRFNIKKESSYQLDYFWSKLVDTNATNSGSGDYDFYGAYNAWQFDHWFREFDAYLFYSKDSRGNGVDPLNLATMGLRFKTKYGQWDTRTEVTQQMGRVNGSRGDAYGTQADVEIGHTFSTDRPLRVGIEGFYSDEKYNQLYPTLHKWLGIADVFGRRNIQGGKLLTSWSISERLILSTDFHLFFKAKEEQSAYRLNGTALVGSASSKKFLGSELDGVANYQWDENNSLQGGFGVFFASHPMRAIRKENPVFGYFSWEMKF